MGAARLIIAGFAVLGVLITQTVVGYSAYKGYGRFGDQDNWELSPEDQKIYEEELRREQEEGDN